MGPSCEGVQTLKNYERMELSLANNVYSTKFSLEHGIAIEEMYLL